ncbi:hypothetical protein J2Y55_002131 [Bosea sp. BE125]|uniref:hypothetical protein n=1 Tax=Bosea sp. BE125 TaxID=2817909 RepID=UPI00285741B8|nr:hypothetical protein [Bosea sp. BE125]MDR6871123.1 hypothetical protein [Bosea sp. BE125]
MQAAFSRGLVFRGRQRRLEAELGAVLANCCRLTLPVREPHWFLSSVFFEAFAEWNDERLGLRISERVVRFIRADPAAQLYEYLIGTSEAVRTAAVSNFSDGSERLRALVEDRRARHANEPVSMRRRIYSALLMIDDVERIIRFANGMGIPWQTVQDVGSTNARRIINEVPVYYIEREIALRLEAQSRPIDQNDFRDMQSFCAAIPYADLVIGENQFVNLARQSGLDRKFETRLATDILALGELLDQRGETPELRAGG